MIRMFVSRKLRVLVVDDTIVYRKAVSDIIEEIPGVELAGVAHNGKIALDRIRHLQPDILTLDIEMPELNGLEVLAELRRQKSDVGAIMLSTLTASGSSMTIKALELGAFDFILKPAGRGTLSESKDELKNILEPLLRAFALTRKIALPATRKSSGSTAHPPTAIDTSSPHTKRRESSGIHDLALKPAKRFAKSEIVAIGISTGGPNALAKMLPQLPANLGVPLLIVQHMPPVFTQTLANSLDRKCALTVKEAENGEEILPNHVYIAPGGFHMKILAGADGQTRKIQITDDPPENSCKPSADYLFRSVADYYVGRATAVIMTGMGSDGAKGLQVLKTKSAHIIGQDEQSCVVYGMPKTPAEQGITDIEVPLEKIAEEIIKSVR